MSVTKVQSNTSLGSTANQTCAYTSNVTLGDLLVVFCATASGTQPATPTDTLGHTYTRIGAGQNTGTKSGVAWWAIANASGANTVTFKNTAVATDGYVGQWNSTTGWQAAPIDQNALNNGTGTSLPVPSTGATSTLALADELVLAIAGTSSSNTGAWTLPTGYTLDRSTNASTGSLFAAWKETAATTGVSVSFAWTTSITNPVFGLLATFQPVPWMPPKPKVIGQAVTRSNYF